MAYQEIILSQILKEVNRYDFKKQISKYNGDYKVSKLTCFNLPVAMVFAHLKPNKTLRDIAIGFGNACYNYLYEIASAKAFFVTRLKSN